MSDTYFCDFLFDDETHVDLHENGKPVVAFDYHLKILSIIGVSYRILRDMRCIGGGKRYYHLKVLEQDIKRAKYCIYKENCARKKDQSPQRFERG